MNLKHHPVLSTKVVTKDPDPIQAIHHEADYSLPFVFVVCKSKYKFDQFLGKSKSTVSCGILKNITSISRLSK